MSIMTRRRQGFTIVELLVVITVIVILATIAVVVYTSIVKSARNSAVGATVHQYTTVLRLYADKHGTYPVLAAGSGTACLGEGYTSNKCWRLVDNFTTNTAWNAALRPFMPNDDPMPIPGDPKVPLKASDGSLIVGGAYQHRSDTTLDGAPHPWILLYAIEGQEPCPAGPVVDAASWPSLSSTPPASGYSISYGSAVSGCVIALPDPAK